MNNEEQFWKIISEMTFNELSGICGWVTMAAEERFEADKTDIYTTYEFASMLADYAEQRLGELEE